MFSLPNILTAMNLVCGIISIIATLAGRIDISPFFLFAAMGFDFLDGFVARKLAIQNELGKQLDSLADMVSFGLAPGIIVMVMIILGVHDGTIAPHDYNYQATSYTWFQIQAWMQAIFYNVPNHFDASIKYLPFLAFIIPVLSLFRLAKFNIDTRQSDSFIGLPTPANALLICFLPMFMTNEGNVVADLLLKPYVLIVICVVVSYLMIAELPLIALKFKQFSIVGNEWRYAILLLSFLLLLILKQLAVPLIIILYVILSVLQNSLSKTKTPAH